VHARASFGTFLLLRLLNTSSGADLLLHTHYQPGLPTVATVGGYLESFSHRLVIAYIKSPLYTTVQILITVCHP
jgi:hypothetical protein